VTDCFALLEAERRPWLDAEELKAKYHDLSARHHPDVAGAGGDFAEINRAYQTLVDPAARLRHLIELEAMEGAQARNSVPEEVAGFFSSVAEARQSADAFLKKYAAAASPVAKALLAVEQYAAQERVERIIAALQETEEALLGRVRQADADWNADRGGAMRELRGIAEALGYVAKWLGGLREALFQLASL
jgi:DnaJ family protein C protein 17